MLKRALIFLILTLTQAECYFDSGDRYQSNPLSNQGRPEIERLKRELIQIEDLKIGDGPLAAWGRKIVADIQVRYYEGTVVYQGPVFALTGFKNCPECGILDDDALIGQPGIELGLNGMAVGGKRRIIADRRLVCDALQEDSDPQARCNLIGYRHHHPVRKDNLIVEATLKEACIPIKLETNIWYIGVNMDIWCREEDTPRLDPTLPIWHVY